MRITNLSEGCIDSLRIAYMQAYAMRITIMGRQRKKFGCDNEVTTHKFEYDNDVTTQKSSNAIFSNSCHRRKICGFPTLPSGNYLHFSSKIRIGRNSTGC